MPSPITNKKLTKPSPIKNKIFFLVLKEILIFKSRTSSWRFFAGSRATFSRPNFIFRGLISVSDLFSSSVNFFC